MNTPQLPLTRNLSLTYTLSLVIAFLMTITSLASLLFQSVLYPTEELRQSFVSNDVVNLLIGLPIMLGSLWLSRRGKLIGLLLWPGALFYVTYNYIAYNVAVPFTLLFVPYLALVILSVYTVFRLITSMDSAAISGQLMGAVPERFAGGVLVGFGALFFVRVVGQIINVLTGQVSFSGPELGVLVADFIITPIWVIGGVMLWRRQAFGYATGGGLLFQASMLFIGLLFFFILQPFMTAVPFSVEDFVVILVMGLICFVPLVLIVRGVSSSMNH